MKLFTCPGCGLRIHFENVSCTRCGAMLGFIPEETLLTSFEASWDGAMVRAAGGPRYRMCANSVAHQVCNWMVAEENETFCVACRLNRTIPDLNVPRNLALWHKLEIEKRRLVYALLRFGLPVVSRSRDPAGLEFDFLADTRGGFNERGRVLTGHDEGLITINIAEADPAERARLRDQMAEPYRTVLGHFRHESGHYYWNRLVRDGGALEGCRAMFGHESLDYGQALENHYASGAPANWREHFVSEYASAHPWEDWAETWAHYLHIVATLETAFTYGLRICPRAGTEAIDMRHDFDPYLENDIDVLVAHWLPLSVALNSLNRSMGHEHAYPFALAPRVIEKLAFVHGVVRGAGAAR